jgi:hypothetical protein
VCKKKKRKIKKRQKSSEKKDAKERLLIELLTMCTTFFASMQANGRWLKVALKIHLML